MPWRTAMAVATALICPTLGCASASPSGPPAIPASDPATPTTTPPPRTRLDLTGFAQADAIVDLDRVDPLWSDTLRPTKLPSTDGGFGRDGETIFSVRQSRVGLSGQTPTTMGDMHVVFDFDMFGVGDDAGETTIRLRHAYGEVGAFGAGQTESAFMDASVVPDSLDYWGPPGMPFYRNIQIHWMPIRGRTRLTIALERPGGSPDGGVYDRLDPSFFSGLQVRFPAPDLSGSFRKAIGHGAVQAGGILRLIRVDDLDPADTNGNLSSTTVGWGGTISSTTPVGAHDTLKLQYVYGRAIENYMNDAPADVAPEISGTDVLHPHAAALPVTGLVAFCEHTWNARFATTFGYSLVQITNTNAQTGDAFHQGQYALANLTITPVPDMLAGIEALWGRRQDRSGPATSDARVQISIRYGFHTTIGSH